MLKKETRIVGVTRLAMVCGRSKTTISRVLNGRQRPGGELRNRLMAAGIHIPEARGKK